MSVENLEETVRFLSTISPPRSHSFPDSLERSKDFIFQKLTDYGLDPVEQKFEVDGNTYVNVVASVGPKEGPRVILGAHYDVCGNTPGADDNASGVAGLLEVARFAKKHEQDLPYGVDLVAFTLEEPPFFGTTQMGSHVHAKSIHDAGVEVRGMISPEMIGFFSDLKNSQRYPVSLMRLVYPNTGDFIGVVSNFGSSSLAQEVSLHLKATSMNVQSLKAPAFVTGVDFSDHRNYWEFGYDAVMITDTAFFRNPNYHQSSDTLDTLNFPKMKDVTTGVCWLLLNLK